MGTTIGALHAPTAPYGAAELKRVFPRNLATGLAIAIVIHLCIVGSYYVTRLLQAEEPPMVIVRLMKYTDLGPPPSIVASDVPPPISVLAATAKPSVGSPVPVPDAEVTADQTLATQQEMSAAPAPVTEATGGADVQVQQDIKIDDDTPPADFVAVEKNPVIIKSVKPVYPDLAMRAGLEGSVWVKIWVDKEGKTRKAVVMKSDADIFEEPALAAARQFVFTPAYMNNGPVAVWVSIPFKFRLEKK